MGLMVVLRSIGVNLKRSLMQFISPNFLPFAPQSAKEDGC